MIKIMYQRGCRGNVHYVSVARSNLGTVISVLQFRHTKLVNRGMLIHIGNVTQNRLEKVVRSPKTYLPYTYMFKSNSLIVLKMFN